MVATMEANRLPVTVVIPVRNEERSLPSCLARLWRFAKVVVVDSASSDGTREVALRAGAEVVSFEWNGRFPKKRNWYLRHHAPTTPWVLFLDADELVDDAFCDELQGVLPATSHSGFWLTYDNWFMGRRLRHGTPNRKLALFRVGAGEYERIEEDAWTALDMEVHEHPVLEGSTGAIQARIDHRDDRGLEHWKRRHQAYAQWEARRAAQLRSTGGSELSARQRAKYRMLGRWWLPAAYFIDDYIRRLGFLDGWAGFHHARLKAAYFAEIGRLVRAGLPGG
jgi:glycosyltransferase involved in cell wall biosynthesis